MNSRCLFCTAKLSSAHHLMLISAFDLRARDKLEIHAGAKNKLKSTGVKVPELFMLLGLLLLTSPAQSGEQLPPVHQGISLHTKEGSDDALCDFFCLC